MSQPVMMPAAQEDFDNLDGSLKSSVSAGLLKLQKDALKLSGPLSGNLSQFRKIAVGKKSLRIIFRYFDHLDLVVVFVIGWRRNGEVYRTAAGRIREDLQG